jgi:hypothetical protein
MNLSEDQKERIIQRSNSFSLGDAKILVTQGLSFGDFDVKNQEVLKLHSEMNLLQIALKTKELQMDSINRKKYLGKSLLTEIRNIYPQITTCTYAESYQFDNQNTQTPTVIIMFMQEKEKLSESEKEKIGSWVKSRLNYDKVKIVYE